MNPETHQREIAYFDEQLRDVTDEYLQFHSSWGREVLPENVRIKLLEEPDYEFADMRFGDSVHLTACNYNDPGNPERGTYLHSVSIVRSHGKFIQKPMGFDGSFVLTDLVSTVDKRVHAGLRRNGLPVLHKKGFLYGTIIDDGRPHTWKFGPIVNIFALDRKLLERSSG